MAIYTSAQQLPSSADIVVIGSGASGLATAITAAHGGAHVVVLEKAGQFGGTTARSGGWLWVPGTDLAKKIGHSEQAHEAWNYIKDQAGKHFNPDRTRAFLSYGPEAIDFFTKHTSVSFDMPQTFPDYHAEVSGGRSGGRSMVTRPFDGRQLEQAIQHLAAPLPELTILGMMLASGDEIRHFTRALRSWVSLRYVSKRLSRHALDVLRYKRGMTLTNGNALAARLAKSALDLNIDIYLNCPVHRLIESNGRVTGVEADTPSGRKMVVATKTVVLACGGFPHDPARRAALFTHVAKGQSHHSPSWEYNTGDGLTMAESLGAQVEQTMENAAAWTPVSLPARSDGKRGVMPHFIDRAKPGVIAVTRNGRRFVNESLSYHDFAIALMQACANQPEASAWLICDHRTLRRYGLGRVAPFPVPFGHHLRSKYLRKGATLADLARQIKLNPDVLNATVKRYNDHAQNGQDPDFHKGSTAYNRFQGDASHQPNPCIAPIEHGPFYAIQVFIGDIGTFAGLTTSVEGKVLKHDGHPIPGLYAVGNDATSIMGGNYPGAGITLGPALTFGYVLGKHLTGADIGAALYAPRATPAAVAPPRFTQPQPA